MNVYKEIKFFYTNADSLKNKMTDLKAKIMQLRPDILAIVETWFQEDPLHKNFFPSECFANIGYNLYRYDNPGAIKGGIIILVKPALDGGTCSELKKVTKEFEESAWHWINTGNNQKDRLLLGCVYRKGSSSSNNNSKLLEVLDHANKLSSTITVCGDFNYGDIDWKNDVVNAPDDSEEMKFYDGLHDLFLDQKITGFTRKRGTDKPSTLDLILTDQYQVTDTPVIGEPLGKSDHRLNLDYYIPL